MEQRDQLGVSKILAMLAAGREDPEAWDVLYRRFWPFVLSVAIRCIKDYPLAEDTAQDVFLRLARYCDFRDFAGRNEWVFRSYVARVVINASHDALRRHSRRREDPLPERSEALATGDLEAESQLRLTLERITERLSDSDAELVRRLADGATAAEIAAESNTAVGTIAVRIHRLRKRITALFASR
jgi:RNA polymerase sigma-70 factor, ECF subfamily